MTMDRDNVSSRKNGIEASESNPVRHLRETVVWLRSTGLLAAVVTLANFMCLVIMVADITYVDPMVFVILSVFLTGGAIISVVLFDMHRKSGEALTDEISDELQWNMRSTSNEREEMRKRPPLDIRIALRGYLRATDLPLVVGKIGPPVYVLVNFIIVFATAYYCRFFK